MKKRNQYLATVLSLSMLLSVQKALPVQAEHYPNVVVIGDSISTGQGLAQGEKSYVDLLENYTNVKVQNFAKDKNTTADVLNSLSDAQIQEALKNADVIIVTAGMHDIMEQFLQSANGFKEQFGFAEFKDVFYAQLEEYGFTDENQLIPYANKMADDIRLHQEEAAANIQAINTELQKYPNAKLVYQTAYNLLDNLEYFDTLSSKRQMAYNSIKNPTKTTLEKYLNTYIRQFASEQENCIAIDVCEAFAGNAYQYTNLYQLEMNPNAKGQAIIADKIIKEVGFSRMGDVTGEGDVDSSDAAKILEYAALTGSGKKSDFSDDQIKGANVDRSEAVDAQDAAQILQYSAAVGSGKTYYFQKYDVTELVDPDPTEPIDPELVDPDPTAPNEK